MKRASPLLLILLAGVALIGASSAWAGSPGTLTPTAPASYVVVYADPVDVDATTDRLEREDGFASQHRYHFALHGFAARLSDQQLARLRSDPSVAFVSPDRPVEAVGSVPLAAGETVPTGVGRIEAATSTSARQASSANVAVIDTGIDLSHPDLNAVNGKNCVQTGTSAQDDNGHGSHVSGTIAAKNTGSGVVGVAPGTKLYAVKVLNSAGKGTWSQVICGIDWVTANAAGLNIKVVSMSLGGGGSNDNNCGNSNSDALHKAICNSSAAGVTYVVAAGNSAADFATFVPAAYPEALTVTAMSDSDGLPGGLGGAPACFPGESDDRYATFSNFATTITDNNHTIAGPGVCTYSTWLSGGYNTISGTSMATPHVTGSVALCLGEGVVAGPCAGLTPAQIVQKMRNDAANHSNANPGYGFTGDPNHPVSGAYYGYLVWDGTTPATADFTINATPNTLSILQGASGTSTIGTTAVGSAGTVNLSAVVSPSATGVTASLSPTSVTAGSGSTLTVSVSATATTGSYTVTVTGTEGSNVHSTTVAVTVTAAPATADFAINATPSSRSVRQGKSTSYTVTITPSGGFSGVVALSVTGLPTGATWLFSPNPASSSSTLKVTTSSATGTYTLTITGVSGSLTHTTSVTLTVR